MDNVLTRKQKDIIFSLARNGLSQANAARELHYSPNAIWYHTQRILDKTGLNPMDFYDMVKLVALAGGDLNGNN